MQVSKNEIDFCVNKKNCVNFLPQGNVEITLKDKSIIHGFLQNEGILVGKLRHFTENGKLSNITDATSGTFNFTKKLLLL